MKKGFIIFAILLLLVGSAALYDYIRAQGIDLEVVSVTPEKITADPAAPVTIVVQAKRDGKPLTGDDLRGMIIGAGNLKADTITVDGDGKVSFLYYPYRYVKGLTEESDVQLEIRDISDSVFIAIQKPLLVTLHVQKPDNTGAGGTMSDIFGDD